eukprot:4097776-Alexandrium_andersonii.AAC.2
MRNPLAALVFSHSASETPRMPRIGNVSQPTQAGANAVGRQARLASSCRWPIITVLTYPDAANQMEQVKTHSSPTCKSPHTRTPGHARAGFCCCCDAAALEQYGVDMTPVT